MPKVKVLEKYCKGCGLCVRICPAGVLALSSSVNGKGITIAQVDETKECTGCGLCYVVCPDSAVEVTTEEKQCPKKS